MPAIPFIDTHFHMHDMKHPTLRWSWLEADAIHPSLGDIDAIKAQHYWYQIPRRGAVLQRHQGDSRAGGTR